MCIGTIQTKAGENKWVHSFHKEGKDLFFLIVCATFRIPQKLSAYQFYWCVINIETSG